MKRNKSRLAGVLGLAVGLSLAAVGGASAATWGPENYTWDPIPAGLARIDLSRTPLAATAHLVATQGSTGYGELIEMEKGYVYFEEANGRGALFRERHVPTFKTWLKASWLSDQTDLDLGDVDVEQDRHEKGPMIYTLVPFEGNTCLVFRINTGRKARIQNRHPATTALINGMHCKPANEVYDAAVLLEDIAGIDILD